MDSSNRSALKLPSGLQVLSVERRVSKRFAASLVLRVGARDAPVGQPTMAHLAEHLAFAGRNEPLIDKLVLHGAYVNGMTAADYTIFSIVGHADGLPLAMEFFANIVAPLQVSSEDFEREIPIMRCELVDSAPSGVSARQRRLDRFYSRLNKNPHWKVSVAKEQSLLSQVSLDAVRQFVGQQYVPRNAALAVVAPNTTDETEASLRSTFGMQETPVDRANANDQPIPPVARFNWSYDTAPTVWICLHYGSNDTSPLARLVAQQIASRLGGGPEGEMFKQFRRQSGAAYNASAECYCWFDHTSISSFVSVNKSDVHSAVAFLIDQFRNLAFEGLNQDWLDRERTKMRRQLDVEMEDPHSMAAAMAYEALRADQSKLLWSEEYFQLLESATEEDLQAKASSLLADENLRCFLGGNVGPILRWRIRRLVGS